MRDAIREAALREASVPTLLMCLAQITGDDQWLRAPYLPQRDVSIFAQLGGGLPEPVQQQIREALAQVLDELAAGQRQLPPLPDADRMVAMMRVCLGEMVPPEYAEMAMEEMGFRDRRVDWREPAAAHKRRDFSVLVVGAGFTGLCAAYRLKQMGIAFSVVDRNPELGGTWFENDYPEAGVDTPNHFYSYAFAPNHGWSSNYSKRAEVWRYQQRIARELALTPHLRLGLEVVSMHWQEAEQAWRVLLRGSDGALHEESHQAVMTAVGQLNIPKLSAIPGIERFRGRWWHSARWPADAALEGRDVAVIGTGASAMQFLRSVAAKARHVTVFQRSPQWARPPQDYHGQVSPQARWLLDNVPYYYAWYRFGLMWRFGDGLLPTVRRDPDWPHPERAMNRRNDSQRRQLTDYLMEQLEGRPDLIEKCLPTYPPYGKRILIDNGWYETLKRPNVSLITQAVDRIEEEAIIDAAGQRHRADVLLMATGFEAGRLLWPMDIRGRNGASLRERWGDDDPRAHLGLTVPGFPNLFVLFGPNTGLAHGGSAIFVAEVQVRYASLLLRELLERELASFEVRQEVHDVYNARVDAEHAQLVWTHPGMRNWYRNARGRVFSPMPWRLVDYWQMTREPVLTDFDWTPSTVPV